MFSIEKTWFVGANNQSSNRIASNYNLPLCCRRCIKTNGSRITSSRTDSMFVAFYTTVDVNRLHSPGTIIPAPSRTNRRQPSIRVVFNRYKSSLGPRTRPRQNSYKPRQVFTSGSKRGLAARCQLHTDWKIHVSGLQGEAVDQARG